MMIRYLHLPSVFAGDPSRPRNSAAVVSLEIHETVIPGFRRVGWQQRKSFFMKHSFFVFFFRQLLFSLFKSLSPLPLKSWAVFFLYTRSQSQSTLPRFSNWQRRRIGFSHLSNFVFTNRNTFSLLLSNFTRWLHSFRASSSARRHTALPTTGHYNLFRPSPINHTSGRSRFFTPEPRS